jgi:hypothetical protein
MEFFDGRKVAFQSKVDSYEERQNARAPIPPSVTLRAEEVAGNRRASQTTARSRGFREDDLQPGSSSKTASRPSLRQHSQTALWILLFYRCTQPAAEDHPFGGMPFTT